MIVFHTIHGEFENFSFAISKETILTIAHQEIAV